MCVGVFGVLCGGVLLCLVSVLLLRLVKVWFFGCCRVSCCLVLSLCSGLIILCDCGNNVRLGRLVLVGLCRVRKSLFCCVFSSSWLVLVIGIVSIVLCVGCGVLLLLLCVLLFLVMLVVCGLLWVLVLLLEVVFVVIGIMFCWL